MQTPEQHLKEYIGQQAFEIATLKSQVEQLQSQLRGLTPIPTPIVEPDAPTQS